MSMLLCSMLIRKYFNSPYRNENDLRVAQHHLRVIHIAETILLVLQSEHFIYPLIWSHDWGHSEHLRLHAHCIILQWEDFKDKLVLSGINSRVGPAHGWDGLTGEQYWHLAPPKRFRSANIETPRFKLLWINICLPTLVATAEANAVGIAPVSLPSCSKMH